MECRRCKKRMRPLVKRDRLGRVIKKLIGVKWCKSCEMAYFDSSAFDKKSNIEAAEVELVRVRAEAEVEAEATQEATQETGEVK